MNAATASDFITVFNESYYLGQVQENLTSYKRSAFDHFLLKGWKKGYNPHPLFDLNYYLNENPDVKKDRWNPWLHFFLHGKKEKRNPCILFDMEYYKSQNKGHLGKQDPLSHFIEKGWKQGKNPSIYFDCRYYMAQKPDLTFYKDPLSHYLTIGWRQKKNPTPYFDSQHYLNQVPELYKTNINPLVHYLKGGFNLKANPHPFIDIFNYIRRHSTIFLCNLEPLEHFISLGVKEGKASHPLLNLEYYSLVHGKKIKRIFSHYTKLKKELRIPTTPYFDTQYYLSQKPSIGCNQDPFIHYLTTGWREGKNPSPYFDAKFYMQQNPPHYYFNESPLSHYYKLGRSQGLKPSSSNLIAKKVNTKIISKTAREDEKLLFMHLPKTAGTSLKAYIRRLFKNRCYTLEIENTPLWHETAYQAALSQYSKNISVLFGHFYFGLHNVFSEPSRYITFLRHPVERIISLYQFQKEIYYSNLNRSGLRDFSLEEILTGQSSNEFNNQMTHMISGILPSQKFENNNEVLNRAFENIENHFSFIGIHEELNKSMRQLTQKMKWPATRLPKLNKSIVSIRGDVLKDKGLVKLIEDCNQLDMQLYEKMRSRIQ